MSLNKVMLIGNVGRDPEIRYTGADKSDSRNKVASFTLATSERYRDRNGEQRENTEWHNIVVWGVQATTVENYVKKGTQLYVEGKIRSRSYDDKTGVKRYITEIVVDNLQLLGRRGDNADAAAGGYAAPSGGYAAPAKPSYSAPPVSAPVSAPAAQPVPTEFTPDDEGTDLPF